MKKTPRIPSAADAPPQGSQSPPPPIVAPRPARGASQTSAGRSKSKGSAGPPHGTPKRFSRRFDTDRHSRPSGPDDNIQSASDGRVRARSRAEKSPDRNR